MEFIIIKKGKKRNLSIFSPASDASMVRERCRLLEGKATQQVEQQTENRSDIKKNAFLAQ